MWLRVLFSRRTYKCLKRIPLLGFVFIFVCFFLTEKRRDVENQKYEVISNSDNYIQINEARVVPSDRDTRINDHVHDTRGIQKSVKVCSPEKRMMLINSPLPIKVRENVNTDDMESSGCFVVNTSRQGIWRLADERNFVNITCGQTFKRYRGPPEYSIRIALKSIPGSGNTWVRHLLEEVTGILTGSVYGNGLLSRVFKGEHTAHGVIAVKTHSDLAEGEFDKAILIVRDILDTTIAEFNRQKSGHNIGIARRSSRSYKDLKDMLYFESGRDIYPDTMRTFRGDIFVLFYDKLKTDLLNSLTKLAAFCDAEVTLKRLWCTLKNSEGSFHRGKKPGWMSRANIVDDELERKGVRWLQNIHEAIANCISKCSTN